jgi:hypothetical protein
MSTQIPTTVADVINLLLPEFPSLATITTATTGTPGIAGINPSLVRTFRSFKYRTDAKDVDQEFESLSDIDHATQDLESLYDLLFLDSWHNYEDSLKILEIGIRIAKPNSIILVHDCLARTSSLSAEFVPGSWSGVTCFVFREFAKQVNREWFVLDSDFGVGVLGPEIITKESMPHSVNLENLKHSELENLEKFQSNPRGFMRGILSTDFQKALHLIKIGESPEYLVNNLEVPESDDEGIKNRIQELESELSLIKNSRIWKLTSFYRWLRKQS